MISKMVSGVGTIAIVVIVVSAIGRQDGKSSSWPTSPASPAYATSIPSGPSPEERLASMMKPEQAAFVSIIEGARRKYDQGVNEMAKGAARPGRAQALCAKIAGKFAVSNWVGAVKDLSSNGDGKGVLAINIGGGTVVKTWNNSLSDIVEHTLIEPSSALFATASGLATGQLVRFSGTFFQSRSDCVQETSMSLAGSIAEPEYVFRFQSIDPAI